MTVQIKWAWFGLAVVVLLGYLLNQGIYVGLTVERNQFNTMSASCNYLYLTGVRQVYVGSKDTAQEAGETWCRPLHGSD